MKRDLAAAVMAGLMASVAAAAVAAPMMVPVNIKAALADPGRPAEDVARDAARKPGELLAWSGKVKPGAKVADLMMGAGYFTRILSAAVGPTGHVYAYQAAEFIQYRPAYGTEQTTVASAYKNVTPLNMSLGAVDLPAGLDLVLTVQNYHDLHLKFAKGDTAISVDKAIFKALKPGGVFLVVDHVAVTGSGPTAPDALHRIDPAIIKQEVESVGFKLAGESDLLRNADDRHTANVFTPAIRGKTDQVVLKFVKP